jgi:hypothetical protein
MRDRLAVSSARFVHIRALQMDIFAAVAILVLLVGAPAIVVNRDLLFVRRGPRRKHDQMPLPFLIVPSHPDGPRITPASVARMRAAATRMPAQMAAATMEPGHDAQPDPEPWIQEPDRSGVIEVEEEQPAPDATVVFQRPVDEPVQILPGRLHILTGESTGEDLHLFRKLGEPARIVVGREKGAPHRHITLRSPTVSRRHARMEWINGCWMITNLSTTNPVLVNNRALKNGTTARKLSDGDRIELGEVALRFLAS